MSLIASIRSIVRNLDRNAALYDFKTLVQQIDESMAQERLTAWLATFFGLFALVLAAIGLYGVISYNVSRRTSEIGIRIALGAQRSQVLASVLRESVLLTLCGIILGVSGTSIATRFIATLLYGLTPEDPVALTLSAMLLLATSAAAAYMPARRATRIDPMIALHYE